MRVSTTTPQPTVRRPVAAAAPAAAPAAARPVARAAGTAPAPAAVGKGLTVNVNGHVGPDGGLGATGTVTLDRGFMERLVRHVTRKKAFGERDIKFDAASGTYGGTVQVKVKGFTLNLAGKVLPVADGNLPGFQFKDLGLKVGGMTLRFPGLKQLAAKLIANEITAGGIQASPGKDGIIRLDPTTLLRDAEVLPATLHLDTNRTRFDVKMAPNGDVRVNLTSDVPARTGAASTGSDLAVSIDEQAVLKALKPVLGNDYQLSKVTIGQNSIQLDGLVEAKPISDVVNAFKGILAAIVAAKGGRVGHVGGEKVMINLKIDAQLQGTQVVLTPSIGAAAGELEKTLTKAGLKPVREGKSLRFDIAPLVAHLGVEGLQAVPGKLQGRAKMDINELIKAPILRGDKW